MENPQRRLASKVPIMLGPATYNLPLLNDALTTPFLIFDADWLVMVEKFNATCSVMFCETNCTLIHKELCCLVSNQLKKAAHK